MDASEAWPRLVGPLEAYREGLGTKCPKMRPGANFSQSHWGGGGDPLGGVFQGPGFWERQGVGSDSRAGGEQIPQQILPDGDFSHGGGPQVHLADHLHVHS